MCNEHIEGDEWGTYVALARAAPPERGMAYRARAPGHGAIIVVGDGENPLQGEGWQVDGI